MRSHHGVAPSPRLTGLRALSGLATHDPAASRHTLQLHSVLNALNRFVGADTAVEREEFASRLALYLVAAHKLQAEPRPTLAGLAEFIQGYAAMRHRVADSIEPRIEQGTAAVCLRTAQLADICAFVQHAIDSLMGHFVPRLTVCIVRRGPWHADIELVASLAPDAGVPPPAGWTPCRGGCMCAARFTAIPFAIPAAAGRTPRPA